MAYANVCIEGRFHDLYVLNTGIVNRPPFRLTRDARRTYQHGEIAAHLYRTVQRITS